MSEMKMRLGVGTGGLALILALAGFSTLQGTPGAAGASLENTEAPMLLAAGLYSDGDEPVRVRVATQDGENLFPEQALRSRQMVHLFVERGSCRQPLQVWVNGRHYPRVQGNLCPENFPDETKTLVIPQAGEPQVVSEDRD